MDKKNLAVIFGGQSNEHEVSVMSVLNVISLIDKAEWNPILIGIRKDGRWLLAKDPGSIGDGSWVDSGVSAEISPDAYERSVVLTGPDGKVERIRLDAAFPVLHGKNGEDGTIQGLFELAQIPYVGCGVFASAASMDKFYTKIIADDIGIRQARYIPVRKTEIDGEEKLNTVIERIVGELGLPAFIKPSRAGSSLGVTKAHDRAGLRDGLLKAAQVDSKILAEEFIDGREIECSVLSGPDGKTLVSGVGEILAGAEFYDYDAKYFNSDSRTVLDPDLPLETVDEIRAVAAAVFEALDGFGLARVDFLVRGGREVVFNEINTMPGFTSISMYPMLWEQCGVTKKELIAKLLESALGRYDM